MNPELTTDQLLQLLDGVVEKIEWSTTPYNPTTITTTPYTYRERDIPKYEVTCSDFIKNK
jgi:hypothetical protein